ncbi:hypothetical protein GCM10023169_01370 [Georgenia halophila]|uniref:Transmembrane protein n=1 Tax=Georgenia halophila TaxID=620889 RepID=A0ABP8KTD3_9MICO
MSIPTASPVTTAATAARSSRSHRLGVAIVAGLAGFVVWLIAVPLLDIEILTGSPDGGSVVGPGAVLVSGIAASLAGWCVLALLERFTARPRRTWTIVALAVLVLSMSGPLMETQSTAAAATLVAMHLAVAAVAIPLLAATARAPRRAAAAR